MSAPVEILKRAGWAPIAVFAAHLAACEIGGYDAYPPLDTPMHLLGGVAIAFFFWTTYKVAGTSGVLGQINRRAAALLTFSSSVACAMFWEFAEFLSDRYLGTTTQKGMEDTLLDMLLGVIGGLGFVVMAWFRDVRADGIEH
jgi:hypothetical protein